MSQSPSPSPPLVEPLIAILDSRGVIVSVNGSWQRAAANYGLEWHQNRNYLEICDQAHGEGAADARRCAAGIRQVIAGERPAFSMEYSCGHAGDDRWFAMTVTPLEGGAGAVVVSHNEITDQRRRMHSEKSLREELRQAQKMETLGQLASGVAHDFSNLLMVILSRCELVEQDLGKLDPHLELPRKMAEIRWASERGCGLTEKLLAFSRKQGLDYTDFDLNDVVTDFGGMLGRLLGEHIRLRTGQTDRPCPLRADRGQLEQILLNLAVNARDAMASGGELSVETAVVDLDRDFLAHHDPGPREPGHFVRLRVHDTGHGIDEEILPRIFEPFFTTKRRGHGTGMGLATAYGIVHQHGGLIEVKTELGRGTTFDVYLPRRSDGEREIAPSAVKDVELRGQETILVVEDDKLVRQVTCEILESLGYEILEAGDAVAAQEWSQRHPGPIHLMLTDVVMPESSGPELTRKLLAERPNMEVLYVTGYPAEIFSEHDFVAGPLLHKPVRKSVLARTVRRLLDESSKERGSKPQRSAKI